MIISQFSEVNKDGRKWGISSLTFEGHARSRSSQNKSSCSSPYMNVILTMSVDLLVTDRQTDTQTDTHTQTHTYTHTHTVMLKRCCNVKEH